MKLVLLKMCSLHYVQETLIVSGKNGYRSAFLYVMYTR